ncbi:tail fiber assembly protein (gpg) [Escherichia coli]|nr:tail fiber assembly protein (gpg) [Escherichia coli]
MMHLKNITAGNPKTKEQYQLTKQFNIKWLYSDDGKNWYEEQKNFQPDTLKMVYDRNGVIICIEKDVSAINPEGASVVELPDITANRRADISGKWMFKDGVVIKPNLYRGKSRGSRQRMKSKACCNLSGIKPSYGTHSYGWASFPTRVNKN